MAACPSCGHENPDGGKFCSECGQPLQAPQAPSRESRKVVTVLFCDVTGSTALGERLDPESLRRVMTRYFERMQQILESHGGTVEKFIGDAVMAVFGIPVLHEDDAVRAVRAAHDMRTALAELNTDLEAEWGVSIATRIGVNTGEVVAGDPSAGQNLVTGDTVNTAARLEQAAGPGEVLVGEATYDLARDAVAVEPVDPLALKGKAELVGAYRLLDVRRGAAGHERRMDSPMVGRERPLRMLRDAFEGVVADRACHLFTVLGPAGMGKSRLAREFLSDLDGDALVLAGRCLSYGEGITFWPVTEIVTQAAGIEDDDPPDRVHERIRTLLGAAPDGTVVARHLGALVGLDTSVQAEPGWAVRRLLETLAVDRPVVAVFDDIHWAEPALLDAIDHVSDWSRDAPILLLCMARPEFLDARPGWGGGKLRAAQVLLEPLGETESDALLSNLLGLPALTPEIRERIRAAAQGNPLFVEEMLSMFVDDGILVEKEGEWVATVDLAQVHVPPAISALVAARLDRLPPHERSVLECAAIEGEIFQRSTVEELSPEDTRERVSEHLGSLLRKDLVHPGASDMGGGQAYRFRHILIREAAYEAMPKQERADLHERFADLLQRTAGNRSAEYEEFVGYHCEQASRCRAELGLLDDRTRGLAERAGRHLGAAGRRARARSDVLGGVNLLERAHELLAPTDPERVMVACELVIVLAEAGQLTRATEIIEEAHRSAITLGDETLAAHARVVRWMLRHLADPTFDIEEAEAAATELIDLFESRADDLGAARAWFLRSLNRWYLLDSAGTAAAGERAAEAARRAGSPSEETLALQQVVAGTSGGSLPVPEARARIQAILEQANSDGNRLLATTALGSLVMAEAWAGDLDEARRRGDEARALMLELGQTLWYWGTTQGRGTMSELDGHREEAARWYRQGYDELVALGEKSYASTNAAMLARVLALLQEDDEALRFADIAEETGATDDIATQQGFRMARAYVAARRGDATGAVDLARGAIALADTTDSLTSQAWYRTELARILAWVGRNDEALETCREAIRIFERKQASNGVAMARGILTEIAGA